jgi:PNKP adenylyltransferase domain, ligase domain
VCLDCELMPGSAKALELVRQQYASVGTAARVGPGEAVAALQQAVARGVDVGAPFHLMATEGAVHTDKGHVWHMTTISSFVDPDRGLLMATSYQVVDLAGPPSEAAATGWWTASTESGGEGGVVKPLSFVATGSRGLLQPAVKCRGREYLRIIYGAEYTLPDTSRAAT